MLQNTECLWFCHIYYKYYVVDATENVKATERINLDEDYSTETESADIPEEEEPTDTTTEQQADIQENSEVEDKAENKSVCTDLEDCSEVIFLSNTKIWLLE